MIPELDTERARGVPTRAGAARQLAETLAARLAGVRRALRALMLTQGAGVVGMALVAAALISYLLDRTLFLERTARGGILVVLLAAVGVCVWRLIVGPLGVRLGEEDLALMIERRHPGLGARLVSALQLGRAHAAGVSDELIDAFSEREGQTLLAIRFGEDVRPVRAVGWGLAGAAAVAFGVWLAQANPDEASIWARRCLLLSRTAHWPRDTHLVVAGFEDRAERRVPKGSDVPLEIHAKGIRPERVRIDFRFEQSGARGRAEVGASVNLEEHSRYGHTIPRLEEPVTFWVSGGDDQIGPFTIDVVPLPWVEQLSVRLEPPAYTREEASDRADPPGEIAVVAGTRVVVTARSSKPLPERLPAGLRDRLPAPAWIELQQSDQARKVAAKPGTDGRTFSAPFVVNDTIEVTVGLVDTDELQPERAPRLRFDALVDAVPAVELAVRDVSDIVTSVAEFPLAVKAKDDYGLQGAVLAFTLAPPGEGAEPQTQRVPFEELKKGDRELEATRTWRLAALAPEPGTFLSFQAEATDERDVAGGPQTGRSQVYSLRVVTREEFLAAMLQRQQAEAREMERVVAGQERLQALLEVLKPKGPPQEGAPDPAALARSEMALARQTAGIAERLERLVAELHANGVAGDFGTGEEGEANRLELLKSEVIDPLRALESDRIPKTAAALDRIAVGGEKAEADALVRATLIEMRRILTLMARHETLAEVITRLEALLRTEREVIRETERIRKTGLEREDGGGGDGGR